MPGTAHPIGADPAPAPPLPPGLRRPARSLPDLPRRADVWWLRRGPDGVVCERLRWRRTGGSARLEPEDADAHRRLRVHLDGRRWDLYPVGPAAPSWVHALTWVDAEPDRWIFVPTSRPVAAYHPADVEVWYLRRAACEAARAAGAPPSAVLPHSARADTT